MGRCLAKPDGGATHLSESLAIGMIWAGALICLIASIRGWVSAIRMAGISRALAAEPAKRRIAVLVRLRRMLIFAGIATAGLCLLLSGLAAGYSLSVWAPALTGGILVALVALYVWDRWMLVRLGSSQ
jgi:hypothetical protein